MFNKHPNFNEPFQSRNHSHTYPTEILHEQHPWPIYSDCNKVVDATLIQKWGYLTSQG